MQAFYIHKITGSPETEEGKSRADGYIDPVSAELLPDKCRFHFPVPASPSTTRVATCPTITGLVYPHPGIRYTDTSRMIRYGRFSTRRRCSWLAGLLTSVMKAGVEVMPETIGIAAENTPGGVKVLVREKSVARVLEARKAIAADGKESNIVESLGLNKERKLMSPELKIVEYELILQTYLLLFRIPLAQAAARSSSPSTNGPLVPLTKNPSGGTTRLPPLSIRLLAMRPAA